VQKHLPLQSIFEKDKVTLQKSTELHENKFQPDDFALYTNKQRSEQVIHIKTNK
jgi:hypothetical protein